MSISFLIIFEVIIKWDRPISFAGDRDIDRLSDLSLGSSVFIDAIPVDVPSVVSKVHKPSPPLTKTSMLGPPDILHRSVIVGQKLAEADGSCRSGSPVSVEKCRSPPVEQTLLQELHRQLSDIASSSASFGTPALTRRVIILIKFSFH
jgi:hypothetical protein